MKKIIKYRVNQGIYDMEKSDCRQDDVFEEDHSVGLKILGI